jgi:hypothetical protein
MSSCTGGTSEADRQADRALLGAERPKQIDLGRRAAVQVAE